jgi:hypothetical protein
MAFPHFNAVKVAGQYGNGKNIQVKINTHFGGVTQGSNPTSHPTSVCVLANTGSKTARHQGRLTNPAAGLQTCQSTLIYIMAMCARLLYIL